MKKIFLIIFLIGHFALAGSITGYKFHDLNANGIDNAEPRLAGFKISIKNINGVFVQASDITDAQGLYSFLGLPLQKYLVCEILPPMSIWIPTTPQCVQVNLDEKDQRARVIFGNRQRMPDDNGCTRTQGFWGSSPQGQALVPLLVPGIMPLGSHNYSAALLDDIFDQPAAGNALLILAHQLIAAKLNILAGASNAPISGTITAADTAINGLIIPPIAGGADISPASPLGTVMVNLATDLDKYNNGLTGVPHCD